MANPICPNTNLQDWKTLVSGLVDEYGEDGAKDRAYLAFFRHNADEPTSANIPSVDEAKGWLTPKKDAAVKEPWQMTQKAFEKAATHIHGTSKSNATQIGKEGFRTPTLDVGANRHYPYSQYGADSLYAAPKGTLWYTNPESGMMARYDEHIPVVVDGNIVPIRTDADMLNLAKKAGYTNVKAFLNDWNTDFLDNPKEGGEYKARSKAITDKLREQGIDGISIEGYEAPNQGTLVIPKTGIPDEAQTVIFNEKAIKTAKQAHKDLVEQALSEGKAVPPEVLADYPDLAEKKDAVLHSEGATPRHTPSPEVKKWFGDSKVVDENGDPLVVYHAFTPPTGVSKHARFDPKYPLPKEWGGENSPYRPGVFHSASPDVAGKYGNTIYPIYLKIEKPLIIDAKGEMWSLLPIPSELRLELRGITTDDVEDYVTRQDSPYDGAIIRNVVEGAYSDKQDATDIFITTSPDQIKSALGAPPSPKVQAILDKMAGKDGKPATVASLNETLTNATDEDVLGILKSHDDLADIIAPIVEHEDNEQHTDTKTQKDSSSGKDDGQATADNQGADNSRDTSTRNENEKAPQSTADKGNQPKAATDSGGSGNKEGQPDVKGAKPDDRSKIGKSIEQKAIEKGLVDSFDRTATFDKKTVEDQKERVSQLVTDPDKVRNIIQGQEPLPRGIDPSMFIRGVELYADTLPDAEQVQLKYELGNSDIVRQTSEAAQTLRFAQEREQDSTTKAISEVKKARTAEIRNILKGRTIETAIKEESERLAAMVKDAKGTAQKKASTRESWSEFITSLTC